MPQTLQASDLDLHTVEAQFHLQETIDDGFFWEWQQTLPPLTEAECLRLDDVRADFLEQTKYPMLEETVKLVVLSPLLALAGFYRSPFRIRTEVPVQIALAADEPTAEAPVLRGRIDVLVVQQQLWTLVIESKETGFSLKNAFPQALSYMMAAPAGDRPAYSPAYSLCCNGSEFRFLKLLRQPTDSAPSSPGPIGPIPYAFSDLFTLQRRHNDLYSVLQILKQLGQLIRDPQMP
jgi:hypothetical protein